MIAYQCECGAEFFPDGGRVATCPECGRPAVLPTAPFLGDARRVCPACGTRRWQKITSRRAFRKKMPPPPDKPPDGEPEDYHKAFFFTLPRECRDCGTIWLPPAPAWALVFVMLVGAALAAGVVVLYVFSDPARGPNPGLDGVAEGLVAGLGMMAYATYALRGRKAGAKLLKLGRRAGDGTAWRSLFW